MSITKKELLDKLREILDNITLQEEETEVKYFKNRQYQIADIIEEKCMNALQHKHTTSATLLIGRDHMYELCLTCDELIKNRDIIYTPFAKLKVITRTDSSRTLKIIPAE